MNDEVIRLKRQLAESGEAFKELSAQSKNRPKDQILSARARVMGERVDALKVRIRRAETAAGKSPSRKAVCGKIRIGSKPAASRAAKTASGKGGLLVNSDHFLDKIVEENNGILKAYNVKELLKV